MAIAGKKIRVWAQVDDRVLELSGMVNSLEVSHFSTGETNTTISLSGSALWTDSLDIAKRLKLEWKCDFCGHVNKLAARYCGAKDKHAIGCGAARPFLLDIQ